MHILLLADVDQSGSKGPSLAEDHKIEFVTSLCNCSALRTAARRVTNYYDEFLRPSGLGTAQYGLLTLIRDSAGLAINEIAANTGLDRTTAGKNIRPLEAAGLVEVGKSRADGRRTTAKPGSSIGCCGDQRSKGMSGQN